MPVDDTLVLDELTDDGAPLPRGRGRSSWIVFAALGFACVFVVVEIFANLGLKDTIGHAEHTLTVAQAAAGTVATNDGSLDDADHLRLAAVEPSLQWIPGGEQSTGLDQVLRHRWWFAMSRWEAARTTWPVTLLPTRRTCRRQ